MINDRQPNGAVARAIKAQAARMEVRRRAGDACKAVFRAIESHHVDAVPPVPCAKRGEEKSVAEVDLQVLRFADDGYGTAWTGKARPDIGEHAERVEDTKHHHKHR